MYVLRQVGSIKRMRQTVVILEQQKKDCMIDYTEKAAQQFHAIEARISSLQQQIEILSNNSRAYKKLCIDIKQATDFYEHNYPNHAEQRSSSIFRLHEWVKILQESKQSDSDKHLLLARRIVQELNAVEHDHNQSSFSRLFTESRLAHAYMDVLRENCIDPYSEKYLAIEYKTVTTEDAATSAVQKM